MQNPEGAAQAAPLLFPEYYHSSIDKGYTTVVV